MDFGLLLWIIALLGVGSGHMIMISPTPYDTTLPRPDPQTWPLDHGTIPFPCQIGGQAGDPVIKAITPVSAGSSTLVQFSGSAVHGGGSCQFSINYGDPTSRDTDDWHVIYTLIGGCPASSAGNLETIGEDPDQRPLGRECGNSVDAECVRQFDVPIPQGLKNGNATFAWSWFNKIGNREMYMNCAPIVVSNGSDNGEAFLKGLPAIFVADIDGQPCNTAKSEGAVLNIPNPGLFGEVLEDPDPEAIGNCSPDVVVPYPCFGAGSMGDISSDVSTSAIQESSAATTSEPSTNRPFATILTLKTLTSISTQGSSDSETTSQFTLYVVSAPVPTFPATTYGLTATQSSAYEKPSGWVECDGATGSFVCLNETHFGICNAGYADPQPVLASTTCSIENNMIVEQE